ncbi:MAG: glycosyltransferase family 2 protein [Nevskiaceae bacterium]|nr:MAG: glycosyltransferase family 2 protein [Nevskiaceae bacterium]
MSTPRPLVSVILPTYNRGYVIRRAVDSVLAQTYPNFELIVVDDGSKDDTLQILSEYTDPRLKVVVPGKNGGAAVARNRGLAVARGDYIAFQDSDDEWLLDKLEKQVAELERHPQAAVCVAGIICVPYDNRGVGYWSPRALDRDDDFLALFRYGFVFSTPAWMIRRSALEKVGYFDESMSTWEDWELSIRLDAFGGFVALDEPLHMAFDTKGSVKFNKTAFAATLEMVMRKHAQWLSNSPRVLARHYRLMAVWEFDSGRLASARRYFAKALGTDPTYLRPWVTMLRRTHKLLLPDRWAGKPSSKKMEASR